jgi:hypothetical protein
MKLLPVLLALALAPACRTAEVVEVNPPAPGFDFARSDPRAIAIADEVMLALGGRPAWDATRCVQWKFAGKRRLCWDRLTNDLRLDEGGRVILMNLQNGEGRVFEGAGELVRDANRKRELLDEAYASWSNDSYWLFAPYKLKDGGVQLTWAREDKLDDGRAADVLRLEFEGVGITPQNAYEMYVARDTRLVEQSRFFKWRTDSKPATTTPWRDWRRYGNILLASDHGSGPTTNEIVVYDAPPPRLYDPDLP